MLEVCIGHVAQSNGRRTLKIKLDLVGVQEVRWDGGGTEPFSQYTFFYGKENENLQLGTVYSYMRETNQQLRDYSSLVIGCHT
jgi:hypothetical protein